MLKTVIDYWDTPYPVLENGVASNGIPMWVREPRGDGVFTLKAQLAAAANDADASSIFDDNSYSSPILINNAGVQKEGRIGTLINYWGGGAPNTHGASVTGNVAYHFRCYLRPPQGRAWWSSATIPDWHLLAAANGFVRIDKVVSGVVTTLYKGDLLESHFLESGLRDIAQISDMQLGDYLDIYYVQDAAYDWGGYVFKAVLTPDIEAAEDLEETYRNAPVIGADLFDDSDQPVPISLSGFGEVSVRRQIGAAATGSVEIPLVNAQQFDAVGWLWKRDSISDPGYLEMYTGGLGTVQQIHRQRLVRIKSGWTSPMPATGFRYPDTISFTDEGWSLSDTLPNGSWVGIDTTVSHSGTSSLKGTVSGMGGSNGLLVASRTLLAGDGVGPNLDYTITVWARMSARAWWDAGMYLRVNGVKHGYSGNGTWQQITVKAASTADSQLTIELVRDAGYPYVQSYDFWWDDVLVVRTDTGEVVYPNDASGAQAEEIYEIFTGFIDDFGEAQQGIKRMALAGFDQRLLDQHIKNYPDRISYMAANYWKRKGTSEPVYDTTAYDAWPMELVLRDLMVRAGLPESLTRQPLYVSRSDGTVSLVTYGSEVYQKFRARAMSGARLRLERPVHYGNQGAGYNPKKAPDDEYIFKPDNTKETWNSVRDITTRYGYEIWFDELGHCVLAPSNNPSAIDDLTEIASSAQLVHPNAYAGTYQQWSGSPSFSRQYTTARIDIILPRFVGAGSWAFSVVRLSDSTVVSSGTINPNLPAGSADEFFYDFRTAIDGSNPCVATLYSGDYDTYVVSLSADGGDATRRADAILLWHTDPLKPRYDHNFSTQENAIDIDAVSTMDEMRNLVLMVGRRKLTTTDSTKLETNPNNPTLEFVVSAAVDVESIIDPTAPNFIGYAKETVVYDERITDQDFANYAANAFIFKYRLPKPAARINHTIIPILRLFEPLTAHEQMFESITADTIVWVTGFEHRIGYGTATTDIETTSYIPIASYEPREDIDIDANFGGNPVIDVVVSYESLAGSQESNVPLGAAADSLDATDIVTMTKTLSGNGIDMTGEAWPPIPGTIQLFPADGSESAGELKTTDYTPSGPPPFPTIPGAEGDPGKVMFNGTITSPRLDGCQRISEVRLIVKKRTLNPFFPGNPVDEVIKTVVLTTTRPTVTTFDAEGSWYYEYHSETQTVVAFRLNGPVPFGGSGDPYRFSLSIDWYQTTQASNPAVALMNNPYHHFFNVDYRDANPRIDFVWKQGDNSTPYARNTSVTSYKVTYRKFWPGAAVADPYSGGSPFYDPYSSELGKVVTVSWDQLVSGLVRISVVSVFDGTVVAYLTEPTADPEDPEVHWTYFSAGADRSVQWDGVDNVGHWNQRQSRLWAVFAQGAFERDGLPLVGKGFYVWNKEEEGDGSLGKLAFISALRDANSGQPVFGHGTYGCWKIKWEVLADSLGEDPRVVSSDDLDAEFNNGDTSAVVYTHLPEPTRVEISDISDFQTGAVYNEDNPPTTDAGYWQPAVTAGAVVHNKKPVRLRYTVVPRPGPQWTSKENVAGFKLNELAHLRVHIFDQFLIFDGTNYPGTDVPKRTLVNRRLTNDDHSVLFTTNDWITGDSLKQTTGGDGREWVFLPKDFKKDFGAGFDEELRFNDYLQLEEVPAWDESRQIAGKRSRFQIAFMNYLFFLSTYTQDRSGRFCWAQNRRWLDRSKIIKNNYADWYAPSTAATVANETTYRTPWQDDLHYQHRRTVVVRQWQDEGTWRAEQRAEWGFAAGSIGDQLLRHPWSAHDPAVSTINGVAWSSFALTQDNYSRWHTDGGRTQLPSQYGSLNRQLGANGSTHLNNWTWETNPIWAPCVTRDFHPYFLLPPMPDMPAVSLSVGNIVVATDGDFNKKFLYLTVDPRDYNKDTNQGNDVANAEVWNSVVWDMTTAYDSSTDNPHVKFWPGTVVNVNSYPAQHWMSPDGDKGQQSNMFDYIRQDEIIHYEDLRGTFSRGPRPAEPSRKVSPAGPYYSNAYSYRGITVEENVREKDDSIIAGSPGFPKYRPYWWVYTEVSGFFDMKFRHQYYWESETLFPTNDKGVEALLAVNYTKSRIPTTQQMSTIRFDDGAWTGWKDDVNASSTGDTAYRLYQHKLDGSVPNVFETGFMPFAVGPRLRDARDLEVTTDMLFSMVLVNERREGAI